MDAYADHLAKVNEVHDVIATDDICNAQGQILVKKGSSIDATTAARIARFKLQKPLEHSVVIENELNEDMLVQCFDVFLNSDQCTEYLYQKFNQPDLLRNYCKLFTSYPLLRQKVTVLSLIMPAIFEQAMFCAWFGVTLSQALGERMGSPENIFIAAMCHDVGMVHINTELLNKQGALTLEEWRQIQAHPVIGYNIVKDTKGIGASVARAVLEHHENLDGTGYPRGSIGSKLGHEGQLLNLLDSMNAIYNKNFKPFKRSLGGLIPVIQMNQQSRFGVAAKQLILLLRELPEQSTHGIPPELAGDVIAAVKARNAYIIRGIEICGDIANEVGFRHDDPKLASIQNAIIHITISIAQSGIVNDAYMRWLDQVVSEKLDHALAEVEEAYLMMQEIIYHIDRLKRQIQLYLEKQSASAIAKCLAVSVEQLEQEKVPEISSHLSKVWLFKR